jgi:hypothetical protein
MTVSIVNEFRLGGIGLADDRVNITSENRAYSQKGNSIGLSLCRTGILKEIFRAIATISSRIIRAALGERSARHSTTSVREPCPVSCVQYKEPF